LSLHFRPPRRAPCTAKQTRAARTALVPARGIPPGPRQGRPAPGPPANRSFRYRRMRKHQVIQLRVSPDDKAMIEEKAAGCNLSVSAYLRKLALEHELQSTFDEAAVRQLQRIGRNLNQAVKLMHRGDFSGEIQENLRRCLKAFHIAMGGEA